MAAPRPRTADDPAQDKRDVRLDILEAMLLLENEKGHLAWKISDLARAARVSRPLVYYHFGRTKQEMLETGLVIIAAEYFGLSEERVALVRAGRGWESVMQTRRMILERPAFAVFYLRWRLQARSLLAERLMNIERRYQAMLASAFPHLSRDRIVALHAVLHGVVTAPFVSDEAIAIVRDLVKHL